MTDRVVRFFGGVAAAMAVVGSLALSSPIVLAEEEAPKTAPTAAPSDADRAAGEAPRAQGAATVTAPAKCKEGVAGLVGKDTAALKDPSVRAAAKSMVNLAACRAVARDSDEPCAVLSTEDEQSCRKTRSRFHDLRASKDGRFHFSDAEYRLCVERQDASSCDAARAALSSGDPTKCPAKMPFGAACRAFVSLDATLCPSDAADCKNDVAQYKKYAGGLKGLKKSGTPEEQVLAAAALGERDACGETAKAALDECSKATAPAPTPARVAVPAEERDEEKDRPAATDSPN